MSGAFADLAAEPRWVIWQNEPRGPGGKLTKIPRDPVNDRNATADDPGTWGTLAEAVAKAQRVVNGAGGGIGIELGDLGHDVFLAGFDLDTCVDKAGALAPWAAEILAAFPSYAERSPSGSGVKGYAYLMSEHVRPFLGAIGVESTAWGMRRSVGDSGADHGPAVEFYAARRYFAVTGDLWPGQPDRIALLGQPALERLAALIPPPRSKANGVAGAGGDDSRSAVAFRRGAELKRQGKKFDEMVEALRQDSETADWVREKGDAAGRRELLRIWEKARRGSNGDDADMAEIARLARLSPLLYDRERREAAERLRVRPATIDQLVRKERGEEEPKGQGRALQLAEPDPWPEAVDGTALLADLAAAIRRHVVLEDKQARTVALWVLAAHSFDAFVIFPRLLATAPEKGCGKSTLLDVIGNLTPKPLKADSITAAALFRVIEAARPSMLLDEADAYLVKENEDLRAVVNSGHRRDGAVIRTVGEDHEPRQFSAWAPMAIAAIGRLPPTIEDRSILIRLKRRRPDERIESLRQDRTDGLDWLCRCCARWAADHAKALAAADPAMPEGIINRAADNWRPLLAVADLAGAGGLSRLDAAEMVVDPDGEQSARLLLLGDLRHLFDKEPTGVLFAAEILKALNDRDDRPWCEWRAGKPITGRQLASLLRPLGIATNKTVRRGAEATKGFKREEFDDAFARYL